MTEAEKEKEKERRRRKRERRLREQAAAAAGAAGSGAPSGGSTASGVSVPSLADDVQFSLASRKAMPQVKPDGEGVSC
jgi:hypothetical protein